MSANNFSKYDFDKARVKQFINSVFSFITNRPNSLYSFEEIKSLLQTQSQSYKGVQPIEIKNIVGSEGRYRDFDKFFLPKHSHTRGRWESIDKAHYQKIDLPPVSVYKINDFYFVKDGNHRVSVAREQGIEFIDAEVIELKLNFKFNSVDELKLKILELEKENFYNISKIDKIKNVTDIECSVIGNYDILLKHIEGHKYFNSEKKGFEIPWEEAVQSWYDKVYYPIVELARQQKIMSFFEKKTLSDLYIWFVEYWHKLKLDFGHNILPEVAINEYTQKYGDKFKALLKNKINEFIKENWLISGLTDKLH